MNKNKSMLKSMFSWLQYKEKVPPSFFIPEIGDKSSKGKGVSQNTGKGSDSNGDVGNDTEKQQNVSSKKRRRTIIKSTPVTPLPVAPVSSNLDKKQKQTNSADVSDKQNQCDPLARNLKSQGKTSSKVDGNIADNNASKGSDNSSDKNASKSSDNSSDKNASKGSDKGSDKSSDKNSGKNSSNDNKTCISTEIETNISFIEKAFNHPENKDIIIRRLCIADGTNVFLFYLDGMADRNTINLSILKPLLDKDRFKNLGGKNLFDYTYNSVIETHQLKNANTQEDAINDILTGNTGIFIDGFPYYILCETKGYEKRSVEKPQIEGVVKGPQEGFNENLRTNITLIRRILKNRELTTEFLDIGQRNNAKCAILYLNDLVNPAIVSEVTRRIKSISTDLMMGDGMLEHYIEDSSMSIVPTILSTERPDRTVSHIVEGKVAILADGTPFALIVPVTVVDLLHTPEDTSLRWQFGTFLRAIRLFAIFVSTLLPGLYVALTNFHREMIPTDLLIAIAKARENVPFPTIVEVVLMEVSFELIREAGIRIPGIIGNTIGIIGALILGQAAVQANLVSPVMIIIVAFTGLGNFAIPDFNLAFSARLMRIFYIFAGASFGFYGISLAILILLSHTVSLNSFGVPIFSTLAPKTRKRNDLLLRMPIFKQEKRPDYLNPLDIIRQPKISRKWTKVKSNVGTSGVEDGKSSRKDSSDE